MLPDGRLHTLGKAFRSEFVAEKVLCARGEEVRWDLRTVDLGGQVLGQLEEVLDSTVEGYCFGSLVLAEEVSVPEDPSRFHPVTARGTLLTLNYAAMTDLDALGMDGLVVQAGRLTLRTRYGRGGAAASPSSARFVHIGALLAPGEAFEQLKHEGDTVGAGEILGRKGSAVSYALQVSLNGDKIRELLRGRSADAEASARDFAVARAAWSLDSAEHAAMAQLAHAGYVSMEAVARSWLKREGSLSKLAALERAEKERSARCALAVRSLEVASERLRSRTASAEGRAAIRATVAGVLMHVRDRERNGRREVGFVVRTLGRQ